ncbi:putative transcriptional regulatory protein, LuxR family [Bradyrhizobium oligotrophicum S58]|uniref:Putative transcriptional regulatory protein, LuxR family n=1 Tax=Bradyrhizobium oligotrophicum S58 TaxID=1245469 RepID=M4Z977_9BRAD|nr:helix-turn-helix transcriptional regulator [Bradyrhizobium oligotrophicum]BAM90209.1 putative transcriptional regulatory protein, LuxR family [Bradyrhizobium oligotrophicum S58]
MSDTEPAPLTIAVAVDDPVLADRLAALLGSVAGVRLVVAGETADVALVTPRADAAEVVDTFQLTARERDVLTLMAEGCSNKEIARSLGISVHTAKFHVGSLLDKLDATGRLDAVAHAARRGIIEL